MPITLQVYYDILYHTYFKVIHITMLYNFVRLYTDVCMDLFGFVKNVIFGEEIPVEKIFSQLGWSFIVYG